jgi:hypothetical protein
MKKSGYKFISEAEPTDAQLAQIMKAATIDVKLKAEKAEKQYLQKQKAYSLEMQKKYAKKIKQFAN